MTTTPLIELANVRLTLTSTAGPVEILRGVDLNVDYGETVSIVGPSGAGKTTLMMVLAGLEAVSHGDVVVAGQNLNDLDEDQLALFRREKIGIVFQSFHLIPTMTALENVAIPLEFAGDNNALGRAGQALDAVGLSHRTGHYPGQLSGGEQQRVGLARSLVARPQLILADEPTGNLDAATGESVMDLLFSLSEQNNAGLVLITHDQDLADRCARQIKMMDGLIEQDLRVHEPEFRQVSA